jgi:hypothetical protein
MASGDPERQGCAKGGGAKHAQRRLVLAPRRSALFRSARKSVDQADDAGQAFQPAKALDAAAMLSAGRMMASALVMLGRVARDGGRGDGEGDKNYGDETNHVSAPVSLFRQRKKYCRCDERYILRFLLERKLD